MAIDKNQAKELELFYENDEQLYRQSQAFVENYNRKKKRGVYKKELAIKGIKNNFIPAVIRKYNKEHGNIGIVNAETKQYLAERWVYYEDN